MQLLIAVFTAVLPCVCCMFTPHPFDAGAQQNVAFHDSASRYDGSEPKGGRKMNGNANDYFVL